MQNSLTKVFRDNYKTTLAAQMDWNEFNNEMNTVVSSNHFCSRRQAMARAAGLAAGVAASTVAMPAYAASTTEVKMGSDSGQLVFVPASITICAGDTVKWMNNSVKKVIPFRRNSIPRVPTNSTVNHIVVPV